LQKGKQLSETLNISAGRKPTAYMCSSNRVTKTRCQRHWIQWRHWNWASLRDPTGRNWYVSRSPNSNELFTNRHKKTRNQN